MFNTTNMNKKSKYLYETMWGSADFDFPVERTNGNSLNSYSFSNASTSSEDVCSSRLIELFDICNTELFKEKFHQSCGGSGNEIKRIATLHSSALCALLFFYNVTEENPLTLTVNGKACRFHYSRFEFKNPVIKNPSNMDVTLVGRYADSDKAVVLFLESKFSEYMERTDKKLTISNGYLNNKYSKKIYTQDNLDILGLTKTGTSNNDKFIISSNEHCYLEGIKQMISHFVGVNNFIDKSSVTKDDKIESLRNSADIYLGAILFDKGIGDYEINNSVSCFESYKSKYEKLADILNDSNTPVKVIKELFSYSMFENADFIKESEIKRFYFGFMNLNK